MTESQHLPDTAALRAALQELAMTERLLVALDFDGTLAPEVDDPEAARALPEAKAAALRLGAAPDTRVALVSGRALASLDRVAEMPKNVLLVGSHGIELRLDTPDATLALNAAELARVRELGALLDEVAGSFEGVWVESKPAGFGLHTRLATDADRHAVDALAVKRTEAEFEDLTMRQGKNVLEFSVRSTTKGEAIQLLRDYTAATATFFAGDDVTDEDALAALGAGDVGLKVGSGETAADFRVSTPAEAAVVLHELADLRDARAHS
ncbi:MAG: trehalose-phosphatase [Lacisediminihabitans sp.]